MRQADRIRGPLASPAASSNLYRIAPHDLRNLIIDGSVRVERIRDSLFVALDDVDEALKRRRSGGDR